MVALIEKSLDLLVDILLATVVRLEKWLAPMRVSRTGYDNPRTRHLVGALGYSSHAYHSTAPNIHKWLKERGDLFPMVLQVQTINRCNARCTICPYPYTTHLQEREIMDDDLYTKIVKECVSETALRDFVPMSKNEPLLDTKLESRVAEFKAAAQSHQMVEIVTNGSGLTPVRARRLIQSGVDLITVSVNAASEKTYGEMMIGLSWRQVMRNLESLAQMNLSKVNIYLRFVSQRNNRRESNEFRKRWRNFNQFMFDVNNRSGTVRGFEKMVIARNILYRIIKRVFWRRVYSALCPYVFSMAHVLQNGDVPMCANDWQSGEVLGNVREKSIREIYNSPRMKEIRELMFQGRYEEIEACRYGIIFAFLGGEPTFPVPGFPEDAAPRVSRIHMMEFDTPYQVLASNSYDAQHFSSVHHRTLLEAPRTFVHAPHHYGVSFRARVDGMNYNDRLLRAIGVKEVELAANCYGGNTVIAYSGRTANYIMFATLPVTETRSRIFVLNAVTNERARKLPSFILPLMLEITHQLTLAFLRADIAVFNELQYKFGILLPESDAGFLGWMRYWNSLPTASLANRTPQTESSLMSFDVLSNPEGFGNL